MYNALHTFHASLLRKIEFLDEELLCSIYDCPPPHPGLSSYSVPSRVLRDPVSKEFLLVVAEIDTSDSPVVVRDAKTFAGILVEASQVELTPESSQSATTPASTSIHIWSGPQFSGIQQHR